MGQEAAEQHKTPAKIISKHSAVGMTPQDAERVEHNGISGGQLVGISDNLTGIVDDWIDRQTPGLVVEDPFAVLTGRLRAVAVAVIRS